LFRLPASGERVYFTENVSYPFTNGKTEIVWPVIDQTAIKAQV
jgi:predicted ester cyclase